jgi:parallel beta-helix repeat protein
MQSAHRLVLVVLAMGAVLAVAVLPGAALAKKKRKPGLYVEPGPDAIAKAIDRAKAGQTIRIRRGRYHEALVIDKPVRLMAAGRVRPVIDGDCGTRITVEVDSPGVILRRLKVVGADEGFGVYPAEVDFSGVNSGRARGLIVRDTCDAEYGINVFDTGPVEIVNNEARGGFSDAGIYIGGISNTLGGALRVRDNVSHGSNRGAILEAILAPADVRVTANRLQSNGNPGIGAPTGLFLHQADGVLIFGNHVRDNGVYGIHLDPGSDSNRLLNNSLSGNPTNFLDQGAANCGSGNAGFSIFPC